jgi:hypothetical protein
MDARGSDAIVAGLCDAECTEKALCERAWPNTGVPRGVSAAKAISLPFAPATEAAEASFFLKSFPKRLRLGGATGETGGLEAGTGTGSVSEWEWEWCECALLEAREAWEDAAGSGVPGRLLPPGTCSP